MRVKTFILASSAAGALALSAGAAAAEPNGWYGAVDAGWHSPDVETSRASVESIEVDDTWAAFARMGYRFDQNWRVEVEGGYRDGSDLGEASGVIGLCAITPSVGPCGDPEGEINATTLMVNVLFDFGNADSSLRPFIGLGAGVNRVSTSFDGARGDFRTVAWSADDESTEIAAQAIAGLAWSISDRAHFDLTYRYLMSNMSFDTDTSIIAMDMGAYEGRYTDHSLTLGLRYAFGADAP
ncbi:MAG: outer membrane beta-barrel protein, partial [Alphaproteobacteria bacterium]|nr:outer membrane beta-barrel protein [Alphaproteobacteria bacterium]